MVLALTSSAFAAVAASRAAKTLMIYLMETNGNVYSWLVEFYKKNPIPRVSYPHNACRRSLRCSSFGPPLDPAAAAAAAAGPCSLSYVTQQLETGD
jgi:hypothetical protein